MSNARSVEVALAEDPVPGEGEAGEVLASTSTSSDDAAAPSSDIAGLGASGAGALAEVEACAATGVEPPPPPQAANIVIVATAIAAFSEGILSFAVPASATLRAGPVQVGTVSGEGCDVGRLRAALQGARPKGEEPSRGVWKGTVRKPKPWAVVRKRLKCILKSSYRKPHIRIKY